MTQLVFQCFVSLCLPYHRVECLALRQERGGGLAQGLDHSLCQGGCFP